MLKPRIINIGGVWGLVGWFVWVLEWSYMFARPVQQIIYAYCWGCGGTRVIAFPRAFEICKWVEARPPPGRVLLSLTNYRVKWILIGWFLFERIHECGTQAYTLQGKPSLVILHTKDTTDGGSARQLVACMTIPNQCSEWVNSLYTIGWRAPRANTLPPAGRINGGITGLAYLLAGPV